MDLAFARLIAASATPLGAPMPVDLTVLLIGVRERQVGSVTARMQAALPPVKVRYVRFAPVDGTFCAPVAATLRRWKGP